ncbi:MAG: hypothetical protein M5U01_35755 [Ardenticatenaceae bacterium]|nr:hypothetical protein [Ardenticatenaceae bacterium]
MSEIEIFLQGEGIPQIVLVRVPDDGTVRDILEVASRHGLVTADGGTSVLLEDAEEALDHSAALQAAGVRHRSRVHVHRCRQVEVVVNFSGGQKAEAFPPSATIHRVKRWAVGPKGFNLPPTDAAEHALQLCNSTIRPDEDTHIGTLVAKPRCRRANRRIHHWRWRV